MHISIKNITKRYPSGTFALNDVSMEIGNGLFGLLGPNGAGKTTLMRILVTLLEPTEGSIDLDGFDIGRNRGEVRRMLGYLPQQFTLFPKLKAWEFLDYSARLAGITKRAERRGKVDEMLETVGLYEARERYANKLSGGMKRRLGVAQALIGSPRILIVDEPTIGLDPEERLRFRNLIADLSTGDIVIILSTHIIGDISSLCTNIAMLYHGALVYTGHPNRLIDDARGHVWRIEAKDSDMDEIKANFPVISTVPAAHGWDVEIVGEKPDKFTGELIEPNLEHAYVYMLEYTLGGEAELGERLIA